MSPTFSLNEKGLTFRIGTNSGTFVLYQPSRLSRPALKHLRFQAGDPCESSVVLDGRMSKRPLFAVSGPTNHPSDVFTASDVDKHARKVSASAVFG